ncbi:Na-dependent neurotransmitter transporter (macronuclear) [Tetrahymena thermophila SB210]|uniref:Transporter n=1 Tax=Tetrahymena thermophila (strain SB210) TaxID=312017 RepID=I7MKU2_TETTS|nr:Na-dependent neurotransmitter transporter [Tetrahymena thermophila SB210]EAS00316.3 Na-dependent neurotransmitter transporter [Tetrahymena thermophila SB210]|eukprot:XP_001020561.3 Na-dependent neurotransmitter transporter [Tetrahymena thermophila SB210]
MKNLTKSLTQNQKQFNEENWYDNYQDEHEARGSHRAFIKAHVGHTSYEKRDQFNNYSEYLLSVLGFAAGFGSVWRFPYLIYKNGGGVFLIPYFLILVLVGIPSFYFETAIGQMFQRSPPQCFEIANRKWKGLGVFGILLTLNMSTYYNLILAYSIYYLWESFKYPLPWKIDDIYTSPEPWNTEYFYKDVLRSSSGLESIGSVVWPLFFCYVLSQFIVYLCICKGITVSGKVSVITASSPYILLFILMIRGLFLDGAMNGLSYLFSPDWSKLYESQVWVDAANQVIFQVSTGCGVLIVFGSYRPMNQEIIKTSYYIPVITVCCGLLASVVIFTFMGYMSNVTNIDINDMPLKGPDLAFIVFPAVLVQMPFSNILSIIFFMVMIFLGIDTQFGQIDALATAIEDEFHGKNIEYKGFSIQMNYIRAGVCIIVSLSAFLFCSQAGFFYLDFVDNYSVSINMFVCIITEIYFYFYIQNWEEVEEKIKINIGQQTPNYMIFLMKYITPLICFILSMIAIYLQILDIFDQKWWVAILGWTITLYPYYSIYHYYSKYKDIYETPKSYPTNCTELNELQS